jgi:hypothetical protein
LFGMFYYRNSVFMLNSDNMKKRQFLSTFRVKWQRSCGVFKKVYFLYRLVSPIRVSADMRIWSASVCSLSAMINESISHLIASSEIKPISIVLRIMFRTIRIGFRTTRTGYCDRAHNRDRNRNCHYYLIYFFYYKYLWYFYHRGQMTILIWRFLKSFFTLFLHIKI